MRETRPNVWRAVRELKALGISVYFEKEDIETAEISTEMLLTLYSQFAQEESISISKNCRIGIKNRMADETYKNPSAPFGYEYLDGKLRVNPEKSAIVKRIFEWYASGIGMSEITARLNSQGNEIWHRGTVRSILTNEKYIGDSLLQKRFTTDALPFKKIKNRGEKEQFYVSGTHEPIVGKSLFDSVQRILSEREKPSGFAKEISPFRRKIFCGNCGVSFRRKQQRNHVYWVCRKHDESAKNCPTKQIRESEFREAFVRLWNKLQVHYKAILAPMLRQLETLYEREKTGNFQLANLRKEIAEIKQQIHLLTVLNSQGTLDDAYFKSRSQELDRKLMTVQKQLRASLDDEENERLDELRKLIAILEKSAQIIEFDEIKFGQIVSKITVLSESEIRFDVIGGIGFTKPIER